MRPEYDELSSLSDGEIVALCKEKQISVGPRINIEELRWRLAEIASEERLFLEDSAPPASDRQMYPQRRHRFGHQVIRRPDLEVFPDSDLKRMLQERGLTFSTPFDRFVVIDQLIAAGV